MELQLHRDIEEKQKKREWQKERKRNCKLGVFGRTLYFNIIIGRLDYNILVCRLETKIGWLVVLGFNATLTAKVISWRSATHVFPDFLTNTTFLSEATDYFSHMLLQRWEAKICKKESSPQLGIELTTTRSWVQPLSHPGSSLRPEILFFKFNY